MLRTVGWMTASSVLCVLLSGPTTAQDAKAKDKDKDVVKDKDSVKEPTVSPWVKVTVVTGKVMAVYEDKRKLRIQVAVPKLDAGQVNALLQAKQALATARDVNAVRQAQQQMAQAQARLYTTENRDVEVQAIEDVVVRLNSPKPDFDDKGRPKKLTKEELKEAKGDPKLPGYKAEFGDVQTDQIVQITVVRKRNAPAPKQPIKAPPKKGKGKEMDMDGDLDALAADTTPQVSMIMVYLPPPMKN